MLVLIVLVLSALGLVMLASTSSIQGATQYHDAYYFVKRQALGLAVAVVAGFLSSWIPYKHWRTLAVPLSVITVLLLLLVLIPKIGLTVKGSSRWLKVGPVNFQPSELAKLSVIVLMASWMAGRQRHAKNILFGLILPGGALAVFLGLIFEEPDFGTTVLLALVGGIMLFLGGSRVLHLLLTGGAGFVLFCLAVLHDPVRWKRIVSFLHPELYSQNESFQLTHALYAFVVGGGSGVGLGQGLQKHFYLPEAHTDFLFAIIGEELGLGATLGIVLLFLALFVCGVRISLRAPDQFGQLLGLGITMMLTLQAAINIAVVTGSMPTKGLPLPFMSFGSSSLLISMTMIGILANLAKYALPRRTDRDTRCIRDAAQRL